MPSRRRADAARNDELFLDAGLELLRERGPDRIAALELARSAGLTTGAVYARYENPTEIMVGLWQHRISTPMRMFLENSLEALIDGSQESSATVMRALTNPSGPLRPGVSVLLASARIPQLAEVVRPDMEEWAKELGLRSEDPAERSIRSSITSVALGCLLYAATDMFRVEDWDFARNWAQGCQATRPVGRFPLPEALALPDVNVTSNTPARDAIVNGAARVIANGGFEQATTQRIARASGISPNELFAQYRTRSELFADVAELLLMHIHEQTRSITSPLRAPDMDATWQERFLTHRLAAFRWLLTPAASTQRMLRLEFHLAALHDDVIAEALRRVDDSVNNQVVDAVVRDVGIDPSVALLGIRTLRTGGLGSLLLQELLGGFDLLDLRFVYEPLVSLLEESVVRSPT